MALNSESSSRKVSNTQKDDENDDDCNKIVTLLILTFSRLKKMI